MLLVERLPCGPELGAERLEERAHLLLPRRDELSPILLPRLLVRLGSPPLLLLPGEAAQPFDLARGGGVGLLESGDLLPRRDRRGEIAGSLFLGGLLLRGPDGVQRLPGGLLPAAYRGIPGGQPPGLPI